MTESIPKSVVVTGASTGIGAACALHLASKGFRVFAGVRKKADGDTLRAKSTELLEPILLDVADAGSIAAAERDLAARLHGGGLDGLVNNAGIGSMAPLEFVPIDQVRKEVEVNLVGLIAVTQALLPLLRRRRGRIVNMGSAQGRLACPFMGVYAATKFALEGLSDALRQELRPWRMKVSLVEPGSVATPIWQKLDPENADLRKALPPAAEGLYAEYYAAMEQAVRDTGKRGISPLAVAEAVEHALTSPRPKTRYLVGLDARFFALLGASTPDELRDWLFAKAFGLPQQGPEPA